MGFRPSLKQILASAAILSIAVLGAFWVYATFIRTEAARLESDQQLVPVQRGDLVNRVSISGKVDFPDHERLVFGTSGIVAKVMVEEGHRVSEGDALASLDVETIASLEQALAKAHVDLRDAEDALEDFVNPPTLDLAKAEADVVTEEIDLQSAEKALDEIMNPSALALSQARAAVTKALVDLDSAEEALETELTSPTALELAEAESKVAAARLTLENEKKALETELTSPTALELAEAESKVAAARLTLENEKKALETELTSPTALELTEAESKVASARLTLDATRTKLSDYKKGSQESDLRKATESLAIAKSNLPIAIADLEVARTERDDKLAESKKELDDAGREYAKPFGKWLGIEPAPEILDMGYSTALADLGVDLDKLFDPANRITTGLRNLELPVPEDDPDTAWDEPTVFLWLNLSPIRITPTCDVHEQVPALGICIEEEFRGVSEVAVSAAKKHLSVESEATARVSSAENALLSAENAEKQAQETLNELTKPLDTLVIAGYETDIALAQASLDDAVEDLQKLRKDLTELREGAREASISDLRKRVALAQASLDDAVKDLQKLRDESSESGVKLVEIEALRAGILVAEENIRKAEKDLTELSEGASESSISDLREQDALARASLDDAREHLADLTSGKDHPDYAARERDVDVARLSLDERRRDLEKMRSQPEDALKLRLLESDVIAARAALTEAEDRLDDAALIAPWDGFVSKVEAKEGQEIEATALVMELVNTSIVEIDGAIDEIDVLLIDTGAEAKISMDALPNQTITGHVSFIGAEAKSSQQGGVVSYPVEVRLELPPDLQIPKGLSAVASITISEDLDVLLVPLGSLVGSFDEPTLNLMIEGEIVERRVELGQSDDFWTVVTEGVSEGDMIVIQGAPPAPAFGFGELDEDDGPPRRREQ